MSYLQNPLNNYSIYSYNIAIYMINPQDMSNIANITRKVLIADNSKKADYNIQSMEQTYTVGNDIVRASYANRFDLVITEPNGVTFFSKIVETSQLLGIPNHLKAMYLMEITFPARDTQNRPTKYPNKFYYPVQFYDVVMTVDKGGSVYNITALENATMAYTYLPKHSQSTLTISGSTVGEVIADLEKKLNEAEQILWSSDFNAVYANEYVITFDEDTQDWANWQIESASQEVNPNYNSTDNQKLIFYLHSGSDITQFIGTIIKSTVEYKKLPALNGGFVRENPNDPSTVGASKIPYTYKVIADIDNLQFDILKLDYQKRIKFKIKKHVASGLVVDPSYQNRTINKPNEQASRISQFRSSGLLRKRYDYIFTGKNTEVINFDIKLNYTYYMMTPIAGGQLLQSRLTQAAGNAATETIREKIATLKNKIIITTNTLQNVTPQVDVGINSRLRLELTRLVQEFEQANSQITEEDIRRSLSPLMTFNRDVMDTSKYNTTTDVVGNSEMMIGSVNANIETSGDLVEIELNIKGDPYWLGKPNSFYDLNISDELADYELGGNMFYLKVNLPTQETSSGRRIVQPEYTLSGVYRVITVTSQFRNGLFTQFLKAYKDTNIQTELVSSNLERND